MIAIAIAVVAMAYIIMSHAVLNRVGIPMHTCWSGQPIVLKLHGLHVSNNY